MLLDLTIILISLSVSLYFIKGILKDTRVILKADPKDVEHLIKAKGSNNEGS